MKPEANEKKRITKDFATITLWTTAWLGKVSRKQNNFTLIPVSALNLSYFQTVVGSVTVDVTQTHFVHMKQQRMQLDVLARLAIQTLVQVRTQSARVNLSCLKPMCVPSNAFVSLIIFPDSCQVNNCGCDRNADCSHQLATYACECKCKIGYTNIGCSCNPFCTGTELNQPKRNQMNLNLCSPSYLFRQLSSEQRWMR